MPSTSTDRIDGLSTSVAIKAPSLYTTTANISLSGLAVQAGGEWAAPLSADDRVFVKDQTNAVDNGIWLAGSGTWRRARDFDGARDAVLGTMIPVYRGVGTYSIYAISTADPIVIGATELAFEIVDDGMLAGNLASTSDLQLGDALVGAKKTFTGSVARTQHEVNDDQVFVEDFYTGTPTDYAPYFTAGLAAVAGGTLYCRKKDYAIGSSITNPQGSKLMGTGLRGGTVLTVAAGLNLPVFDLSVSCRIENISIVGSATALTPLQSLIKMTTCNEVEIRNCYLTGGYDLISINGTCFYIELDSIRFYNAINSWVSGASATASGFDLKMHDCRGTPSTASTYGLFFDGLGSIIMSDCQFSPGSITAGCMYVNSIAANAGTCLFDNVVFEASAANVPGIYFKGTALQFIQNFEFSNCYIAGAPSVRHDYAAFITYSSTTLTGPGTATAYDKAAWFMNDCEHITYNACTFLTTSEPLYSDPGITALSVSVNDPVYTGADAFINFPIVASKIDYLNVRGGTIGTNATPIVLNDYKNTVKSISAYGSATGPIQEATFVGSLGATGGLTLAHGISGLQTKLLSIDCVCKGGSGEAIPVAIAYVDGTSVSINAGAGVNNAHYRIHVRYMLVADTNW